MESDHRVQIWTVLVLDGAGLCRGLQVVFQRGSESHDNILEIGPLRVEDEQPGPLLIDGLRGLVTDEARVCGVVIDVPPEIYFPAQYFFLPRLFFLTSDGKLAARQARGTRQ